MTIAVGQILDKYELLEKVGQGGMAVVYRGLDRSLGRHVAIKVLHRHLAELTEARDRFEREARAVAKLHHENILEIFDFSGSTGDDCYIVTEFIDGQTLREFVTDHPITYPEIGAMITVQVCRALGHAHGLGILHRDIKPENIMIRSDGIVKLTDFGIAQVLDMQRMTMTGQLLGSPAYMAPEHVEGGPLDFRTDVFAVGIVLYWLVTGELPFQGKNAHEILKRIADCTFVDPRKKNPLVGNQLGRIILRAMARKPDERFGDISEMLFALEEYLAGSGLREQREELGRFFAAPVSYELALRERLLAHLTRRSRELMATDQVAALEVCNRVLTIDPGHKEVLGLIERMSRRQRWRKSALVAGGVLVAAGVALAVRLAWPSAEAAQAAYQLEDARSRRGAAGLAQRDEGEPAPGLPGDQDPPRAALGTEGPGSDASSPGGAAGSAGTESENGGPNGSRLPGTGEDARSPAGSDPTLSASHGSGAGQLGGDRPAPRDPAPGSGETGGGAGGLGTQPRDERTLSGPGSGAEQPARRTFTLHVSQRKSEYRLNSGPWLPLQGNQAVLSVGPGSHTLEVRNQICCQAVRRDIPASMSGGTIPVTLGYLPATITPRCKTPGVRVQIDGKPVPLGHKIVIPISEVLGRQSVTVVFIGERTDERTINVRYNESRDVTCELD